MSFYIKFVRCRYVEFFGQKACWTCVRFRRLVSLTGWDGCDFVVIVIVWVVQQQKMRCGK